MNNIADLQIIDTSYYSLGFPIEDFRNLLPRDNYTSQIKEALQGSNIIFIEGDEDAGKTTLCAQFVKKNITNSISVFFNPDNNLDYNLDYFFINTVDQLNFILGKEIINSEFSNKTKEEYRSNIFQLRKKYRTNNNVIYLIIDGLEKRIKSETNFINDLFDMILGEKMFKIIITGYKDDFINFYPKIKKYEPKSINLTGFSTEEIKNFLNIQELSSNDIDNLYSITKGYPGRLKTLKRLLINGDYNLNDINKSTEYKYWIELDCDRINLDDENINKIISILLFSDKTLSISELSKISGIKVEDIKLIINEIDIIYHKSEEIYFISKAHKDYLSNILRIHKKNIDELLFEYYTKSETIDEKYELSKILVKRKKWNNLLEMLDDEYFQNLLENNESLQKINESLDIGIKASEQIKKYPKILRYSLQGSIINELDDFLFWESEIKARIATNDFNGAITLAESAVLKSDRLRLLALIAKKQKEISKNVDEDLINLIKDLYLEIDLNSVGNTIYDIVADLIYAIPNLAIEIIEKTSDTNSDKSINDWIIAKLSVAAIDSNLNEDENNQEKKIEALQKLNNPSVKKISRAISLLIGNYSAVKLLDEIKKLSDPAEKLRLLRLWLNNNNRILKGTDIVIKTALDELIKSTTESNFTLDILKELTQQLPYVKDINEKKELLRRIKTLENDFNDTGLTKNKYIYLLNIFHTEFLLDIEKSIHNLNRILIDIEKIEDTLIKLESYAEVYSKLKILPTKNLSPEVKESILKKRKFAYHKIFSLRDILFNTTADHFKVIENVIETISKVNPLLSLKICEEINTLDRRDRSRLYILDTYLENNIKYINITTLKEIENSFEDSVNKDSIIPVILERFTEAKHLNYNTIKELQYYNQRLNKLTIPYDRLIGKVYFHNILAKNEIWKSRLLSKIQNDILNIWKDIDSEWDKIDYGFKICAQVAKVDKNFAKKLLLESEIKKNESWLDSRIIAYTYLNSIKLIITSFSGLLITEDEFINEGYKIIENIIDRLPSKIDKLRLWTELGFHCTIYSNEKLRKNILDTHIIPLFDDLLESKYNFDDIIDSFTLLHIHNKEMCFEYTSSLPVSLKEKIFVNISQYYLTKQNPFEIYDGKPTKFNTSYNDILNSISIINNINTDRIIYSQISLICEAISNNTQTIQKAQLTNIIDKLEKIINNKLPDINNITHNGFKIISKVKLSTIKKGQIDWVSYIKDADNILNISDKIFVKAILIENIPFGKLNNYTTKEKYFNDIIDLFHKLNIHYEYVQRVIDISEIMYPINKEKWKEIVNNAFSLSNKFEEGSEIYFSRKNIIDSMYRLDPDYAKELINISDSESEKKNISKHIKDYYLTLEISKKIKNNQDLNDKEKNNYRLIINGIYKTLGAINSNRVISKKINEIAQYLPIGNKLPLQEVFPIFLYYYSNCSKVYSSKKLTGTVKNIHKFNFEETVNASNTIHLLSKKKKNSEKLFRDFFIQNSPNKTIHPNSREEAINFIKDWMSDELESYIIIADPYFDKDGLEILKLIKSISVKNIEIDILGSNDGYKNNIENEYKEHWKKISDELPPYTNITFCWVEEDKNIKLIHDRWIITKNSGLRLGTSFNSLGIKRESEISIMRPSEATNVRESILMDFINRRKKEVNNQRLSYKSFTL